MQSSGIQLSGICFASWAVHSKNSDPEIVQMGIVINKRFRNDDRRQNDVALSFPTKDSNGEIIKECRRKIPNRRIDNIKAEWIDEIVIG